MLIYPFGSIAGFITIIAFLSSVYKLIIDNPKKDIRIFTLSELGSKPETKKYIRFALTVNGILGFFFMYVLAKKLQYSLFSYPMFLAFGIPVWFLFTILTLSRPMEMPHWVYGGLAIFAIYVLTFLISSITLTMNKMLSTVGIIVVILNIIGSAFILFYYKRLNSIAEIYFSVMLSVWVLLYSIFLLM